MYIHIHGRTVRTIPYRQKLAVRPYRTSYGTYYNGISQVKQHTISLFPCQYLFPTSNMNDVKYLCIQVSTIDGESLLCETYLISFGPEGLLRIPERLRYVAKDLLCFPKKEETRNLANQGALFSAICEALKLGTVSSFSILLLSVGFAIEEDSIATIWVRCDPAKKAP